MGAGARRIGGNRSQLFFRLTEPQIVETEEAIGDPVDRFILRVFHRPTTRKVKTAVCPDSKDIPARFRRDLESGYPTIDIEIDAITPCIQTETSELARAG